ncbi:MAG: Fe-S cluster assembly protein SufD [candidate division Zixibacteria bacterium]|nr:Fe-S cluster assembly protein SufD [candidate division Zixibacteria bacterium]
MNNIDFQNKDFNIPELSPELLRGSEWLKEKRETARNDFNKTPLPPRNLHLWRYTNPEQLMFDANSANETSFGKNYDNVVKLEKKHLEEGSLSGLVTDIGGRDINFYGFEKLTAQGIIACKLSDAFEKHNNLVEKYLYQLVNNKTGKFEAMNGALWNDGIFIYIPNNIKIEHPIHLLREAGLHNSITFPRLLVITGENSELTLIDEYGGGSQDMEQGLSFSNGAVEIFGLQNSRTRYVSLQRQTSAMNSFLTHRAHLEHDAQMLTLPFVFGASLSKQNFGIELTGDGANSNIYGLLFGSNRQHLDNHTFHHHTASNTTSDINFKVVLKDKALSAYTGLIKIETGAKNCEAFQENRNLLLNKGTKAETIPELEILNEEVSCSHGATIGPIDEETIFYLNARGIDKDNAVKMIVSGFMETTLQKTPEDLKERLTGFLEQRLEDI